MASAQRISQKYLIPSEQFEPAYLALYRAGAPPGGPGGGGDGASWPGRPPA